MWKILPNVSEGELGASVLFKELTVRLLIGRVCRYLNNALGLRHGLVWFGLDFQNSMRDRAVNQTCKNFSVSGKLSHSLDCC